MFKRLIDNIKQAIADREPFDPSRFNDPLAETVEWSPAKSGGANFCTHKLCRMGPTRVGFKMTFGALLFGLLFTLIGLGMLGGLIGFYIVKREFPEVMAVIMLGFMGLVFSAVGIAMLRAMSVPRVIDTKVGLYWRGRQDPRLIANRNRMKECLELKNVHAIQIISEFCRSSGRNSSSYRSYEINFVMHDGNRVNIVDHGNHERIRRDAAILAETINVPLWDGS